MRTRESRGEHSFILDTTTLRSRMPSMAHGDFERFGKLFWNHHKRVFGAKLEVAVAMQRRPVPIATHVAPAGRSDLRIAREGIFQQMDHGEIALGDPGYVGQSDHIYAPPRRNMISYVPELDKAELTLQRRVEMANQRIKTFKCVGTIYRKGAVHAYPDLLILGRLVPKLVLLDIIHSPQLAGQIHFVPCRTKLNSVQHCAVGKKSGIMQQHAKKKKRDGSVKFVRNRAIRYV